MTSRFGLTNAVLFDLLRRAAKVSTVPLALSACVDTTNVETVECAGFTPALRGIAPVGAPTSLQLRETMEWRFAPDGGPTFKTIDTVGTPCGDAANPSACNTRLGALSSTSAVHEICNQLCIAYQVVTTKGDTVTLIDTEQSFRDLLGTIDSPQEAAWLAYKEGFNTCGISAQYGATGARAVDGGYEVVAVAGSTCGPGTSMKRYLLRVTATGAVEKVSEQLLEVGNANCVVGRRPEGLELSRARSSDAVAAHFEAAAALEAAAVEAFEVMALELTSHGAPGALVRRAWASADDERRHTRAMASLARQFGGAPRLPQVTRPALRSLEALARENVVEGCVRETFGAMVALRQASAAADQSVREAHGPIAMEEVSHAALSWDVHGWALEHADRRTRQTLRHASRAAVEQLKTEFAHEPSARLAAVAGLPSGDEAVAMIEALDDTLYRRAL